MNCVHRLKAQHMSKLVPVAKKDRNENPTDNRLSNGKSLTCLYCIQCNYCECRLMCHYIFLLELSSS